MGTSTIKRSPARCTTSHGSPLPTVPTPLPPPPLRPPPPLPPCPPPLSSSSSPSPSPSPVLLAAADAAAAVVVAVASLPPSLRCDAMRCVARSLARSLNPTLPHWLGWAAFLHQGSTHPPRPDSSTLITLFFVKNHTFYLLPANASVISTFSRIFPRPFPAIFLHISLPSLRPSRAPAFPLPPSHE